MLARTVREDLSRFKRPESILLVVYTKGGDALLLKRVHPTGFWQSVTGSMKWHEILPAEAAVRELREETGIDIHKSDLHDWKRVFKFEILPAYKAAYPQGTVYNVEHMFSLELDSVCDVRLNPNEHSEYCWQNIESAIKTVWSWSNRQALDLIQECRS